MTATMDVAEAKRVAQQVFQDADKDKNGFLTKSEIRKYFKKHPAEKNRILGSDFQWNEFFTNMDKNGDNKFDVDEFTNFVIRSSKLAGTKKEETPEPNAHQNIVLNALQNVAGGWTAAEDNGLDHEDDVQADADGTGTANAADAKRVTEAEKV